MQIKVNAEIRDIKNEVFFGLSMRQIIGSALCVLTAVITYPSAVKAGIGEDLSWALALCACSPFAIFGFLRWHGMAAEQIAAYVLHTLLTPRRIVFKGTNTCDELIRVRLQRHSAMEKKKRRERFINGCFKKDAAKRL